MTATAEAVRARLLVVVTAEDQVTQIWAVGGTGAAVHLCNHLQRDFPGYDLHVCRVGDVLAHELVHIADELDRIAVDGGSGELPAETKARRDGIAAAAAVIRHRGERLKGWQP